MVIYLVMTIWPFYGPGYWGGYLGASQPMLLCVTLCPLIKYVQKLWKSWHLKGSTSMKIVWLFFTIFIFLFKNVKRNLNSKYFLTKRTPAYIWIFWISLIESIWEFRDQVEKQRWQFWRHESAAHPKVSLKSSFYFVSLFGQIPVLLSSFTLYHFLFNSNLVYLKKPSSTFNIRCRYPMISLSWMPPTFE